MVGKIATYRVFYKNDERKRTELMGMLIINELNLFKSDSGLVMGFWRLFAGALSVVSELDETEGPMKLLAALLTLDTIILTLDIMVLLGSFY